jgi:hypothetical protein
MSGEPDYQRQVEKISGNFVAGVFFDLSAITFIGPDRTTNVLWLNLELTKVANISIMQLLNITSTLVVQIFNLHMLLFFLFFVHAFCFTGQIENLSYAWSADFQSAHAFVFFIFCTRILFYGTD